MKNIDDIIHITLCGSFGQGNIGDEAIVYSVKDICESEGYYCNVDILSRFSEPRNKSVIGLNPKDSHRRELFYGHPLMVAGGGVIENHNRCVLLRCSNYFWHSFSPSIGLWGAGVESGVDYSKEIKKRLRSVLKRFDVITVRDKISEDILINLYPNREIQCIGDPVLFMRPERIIPKSLGLPNTFIAVCLRSVWSDNKIWTAWIGQQLVELSKKFCSPLVFIPFSIYDGDDRIEHRRICRIIQSIDSSIDFICIEKELNARQVASIIEKSLAVISMRLHGCVIAYGRKRPFVAITYHPKLIGFAMTVEWDDFVVPKTNIIMQRPNLYGYKFEELGIERCDLVKICEKAIQYENFRKLETYQNLLVKAFEKIVIDPKFSMKHTSQ